MIMNIEEVYEFCLAIPGACVEFPFDNSTLVFKVMNKMFAVLPLEKKDLLIVKCDPEKAIDLRERYCDINPAWHFNKKYWNQINLSGSVKDSLVKELIMHSYEQVLEKLPKYLRVQLLNLQNNG